MRNKKSKMVWKGSPRSYSAIMNKIKEEVGDVDSDYLKMSDAELEKLPAEDENGICFYEVGDVLLGKEALIRFVKNKRIYK